MVQQISYNKLCESQLLNKFAFLWKDQKATWIPKYNSIKQGMTQNNPKFEYICSTPTFEFKIS